MNFYRHKKINELF